MTGVQGGSASFILVLCGVLVAAVVGGCQPQEREPTPVGAAPTVQPIATATLTPVPSPAVSLPPASDLTPRPLQCGDTITTNTLLAHDLTCQGDALIIGADNLYLDLGGHTLTGPGRGPWVWPERALSSVGIRVEGRRGVWIGNGKVTNFATGVLLDNALRSEVHAVISEGNFYGIYLVEAMENRLEANIVTRNTYGIHLQRSSRNAVVGNDSFTNLYQSPGGYGMNLIESHNNEIRENVVRGNVNQGIWVIASQGNLIYRNDLIGNSPNGVDDSDANAWNRVDVKQGNHWSDYEGKDADGDGIGDSPYTIGGGGKAGDLYPAINPYRWKEGR